MSEGPVSASNGGGPDAPPARAGEPAPVPVVAVGASAGGLQAFERFFNALERGVGAAVVVVQHLAPEYESILPDLVGSFCALPVEVVTDGVAPQPDHVYVIPPNATLLYRLGRLRLEPLEPRVSRQPISAFFGSLAEELGVLAGAVLMSGTGSDGAAGVRAVKGAGGFTLVQSPAEALYDAMPRNALATGDVDYVVPAGDMPAVLARELRRRLEEGAAPPTRSDDPLEDIARSVARHTGHDLASYKSTTVLRRIRRRMDQLGVPDLEAYRQRVEDEEAEAHALVGQLMIGVTRFFRDPEVFTALSEQVVPRLLAAAPDRPVRVWVPGCASGEEAYSIAIVLRDAVRRQRADRGFQVFATDIDEAALQAARRARYPRAVAADVPPAWLERYFVEGDGHLEVAKEIRDACIFSSHDVLRDAPFSRLDLVSCRNLLIYFEAGAQERLLPLFHYALRPGGFLLLGSAETVNERTDLLEPVDRKHRLYLRRELGRPPALPMPLATPGRLQRPPPRPRTAPTPGLHVIQTALAAFLEESGAALALVDARGEARYFAGPVSRFLPTPTGVASLNVLELAPPGLRSELGSALLAAAERAGPVRVELPAAPPERPARTEVRVRPVAGSRELLLLLLRELPAEGAALAAAGPERSLEDELQLATDRWRRTVEEQHSTHEQLRSANEELQSMNEELQSANEELQVSQEELQSINEELHTVNAELNKKVDELNGLYADLQNLFRSTQIATIFLDRALRIGRYTPAAGRLFPLSEHDAGRPLADLVSPFAPDVVLQLARSALDGAGGEDRVAPLADGSAWFLVRARPYTTLHGAADGVVLTFVDVTELKRAEEALRRMEERERRRAGELEAVMRTVPAAILITRDPAAQAITGNEAAYRILRMPPGSNTSLTAAEGERPTHFQVRQDGRVLGPEELPIQRAAALGEEIQEYEEQVYFDDGSHVHLWGRAVPLRGPDGRPAGAVGAFLDVTKLKHAEESVRRTADALVEADRRKDEFLALLGHELRNPLAALQQGLVLARDPAAAAAHRERHLGLMQRQLRALTRLVDDLLDVTRITSGKIRLQLRPVDVVEAVRHELEALQGAEGGRLRLQAELPPDPVWVRGDADRIAQMLANLLGNACKFTDAGGQVQASVVREEDGRVAVRVRDSGVGMDQATLARLFQPFHQAERTLDHARGGLGLGLSLVRSLAQLMGAEASAASPGLGQGAEFTLRFQASEPPPPQPTAPAPRPAATRLRVLVVEDNADVAESLAEYVESLGHAAALAADGQAGLARAREVRPDLVLCDLGLPLLDGYGVARALRADPALAGATLVALSGYGQAEDRERSRAAGFDHHFTKPVDPEVLSRFLASMTSRG